MITDPKLYDEDRYTPADNDSPQPPKGFFWKGRRVSPQEFIKLAKSKKAIK